MLPPRDPLAPDLEWSSYPYPDYTRHENACQVSLRPLGPLAVNRKGSCGNPQATLR